MTPDEIAFVSLVVAAASLVTALVALVVSGYAAWRSNLNTSAGTLVSFNANFGEGWRRFIAAQDEAIREFKFAELVNMIEAGCALYLDRAVHGRSREILARHLNLCLGLFENNVWCRAKIAVLRHEETTWQNIVDFQVEIRRAGKYSTGPKLAASSPVTAPNALPVAEEVLEATATNETGSASPA